MRLSEYTDYTLRVLMYCAARPQQLVTIGELAEHHGLSKNHLMKIVNDLARQGVLETTRGRGGGLRLLKDPARHPHRRRGARFRDRLPPGGVFRPHHQRLHADAILPPETLVRRRAGGLLQGPRRHDAGRHDTQPVAAARQVHQSLRRAGLGAPVAHRPAGFASSGRSAGKSDA
jgi:hypothetical protein